MNANDSSTVATVADDAPLLDDSGHFHATDAPIDLSHYLAEDWLSLAFFWLLGANVFYQFFTRYALNDSAAWTEEIARYLLIGTVFVGMSAAVREERHIHVDFLYRFLGHKGGRFLATVVDLVRIVFFAYCVWLTIALMRKIGGSRMAIIDWPIGILYGFVCAGFVLMTWRAVDVGIANWKRGYSVLERPELADEMK